MTDAPKYEIADDHEWPDEKQSDDDRHPYAEIDRHMVVILDRRGPDEQDMQYRYVLEDGIAIGILRAHQLGPSNQYDPAGAVEPFRVPGRCRKQLAAELGADHWCDVVDIDKAQAFADW